ELPEGARLEAEWESRSRHAERAGSLDRRRVRIARFGSDQLRRTLSRDRPGRRASHAGPERKQLRRAACRPHTRRRARGRRRATPRYARRVSRVTIVDVLAPILIALVFIALASLIHEPRRRDFNAIMVAGAGAAYLGAGLGGWELLYTSVAAYLAYRGLTSYT